MADVCIKYYSAGLVLYWEGGARGNDTLNEKHTGPWANKK